MTANKMPVLPDAPKDQALSFGHTSVELLKFAEAYGRACYLAGLEAARSAIPPSAQKVSEDSFEIVLPALTITITAAASMGWNTAVLTALTNLTALEQEAKK